MLEWRWLRRLTLRLRTLFQRDWVERELEEEFQFHIEQRTELEIARGLSPEEARCAALRAMDGAEQRKEECRDMRHVNFIDDLWRDLRYAGWSLRRNPGFATVAILSLAIGIGANTTLFSIINAVLLRPLPYPDSDRLVWVGETRADLPFSSANPGAVSYENFVDWHAQQTVFESIGAYQPAGGSLGAFLIGDEPVRLEIQRMSADAFVALRVTPVIGRVFNNEEDRRPGRRTESQYEQRDAYHPRSHATRI